MGAINILDELNDSGKLDILVKSGILSYNQYTHYKIYKEYNIIRLKTKTSKEAYDILSCKYNLSSSRIKHIVRDMRKIEG